MATTTAAVMFTDLVDSTGLSARLGRRNAEALFAEHFVLVGDVLAKFGGEEVKRLGDGVMAVFATVSAAVECAVALQQAVQVAARSRPDPAEIRVGVSVGEVRVDDGDYFGTPVVEAARLCAIAATGQVLCSAITAQLCGSHGRHPFRALGTRSLKGFAEPVEVVEVIFAAAVDRGIAADFARVDSAENPEDVVRALDAMRDNAFLSEVRAEVFARLAPKPSEHVLDVGSGNGDDVLELAPLVGPTGSAAGVEKSEMLVAEATRRASTANIVNADFHVADARQLPFDDATFDACCSQRTFQYLTDPLTAVREMVRVTRPGGRIVIADTDWETAIFDGDDVELTARINRAWCDTRPSGRVAHQLYGMFRRVGLHDVRASAHTAVMTAIDDTLGNFSEMVASQAINSGAVTETEASLWIAALSAASHEGRFFRSFTMFITSGVVPLRTT